MEGNREKGPVQILCEEIGYPFDIRMERTAVLVSFVLVLIDQIDDIRDTRKAIATAIGGEYPQSEYDDVRRQFIHRLQMSPESHLIEEAARLHKMTWQPDEGPCDHYIDMLSSCISAIRFGLERPCRSRHAAEAASHIWRKRYTGTSDRHTGAWVKDWTRAQFQEALFRLIATA